MVTPFNWRQFVIDHRAELNIVDEATFWQFWRHFFCGSELERNWWKQNDPHFQRHVEELRRVIALARKSE